MVETFGAVLPRAFLNDLGLVIAQMRPDLVVHEVANVGAYFAAKRAAIPGYVTDTGALLRATLRRQIAV